MRTDEFCAIPLLVVSGFRVPYVRCTRTEEFGHKRLLCTGKCREPFSVPHHREAFPTTSGREPLPDGFSSVPHGGASAHKLGMDS